MFGLASRFENPLATVASGKNVFSPPLITTTPTFMMPLLQPKLYELGRRLGKQGPRRLSRSQPPRETGDSREGDKSVTVDIDMFLILQLNANGLGPAKLVELNKLLHDKKIQVL